MTCVWEPDTACLSDEWAAASPEDQERALMFATSALQGLTLYRVGLCPVTIRPCPVETPCGCGREPHTRRGNCAPLSEFDIPGPVGYIETLMIDGVPVDLETGDWRLDNGHLLVWQGIGPSPLPSYQDLSKPDSEVGTWSLTYSRSYPVGPDARIAVARLAMEFLKACQPKGKCSLPRGVTNVVRQGVTFTIESNLFPGGVTGDKLVDAFIMKWAPPESPLRAAVVFDPRSVSPRITSAVPTSRYLGSA